MSTRNRTKMDLSRFKKNLKKVRMAKQLTAKELAVQAEIKTPTKRIHDFEERAGVPSLDEVVRICEVLDVSIDDMLNKEVKITFAWEQ